MARKASPWYWKQRNQWLVTIDGKRHKLGEHPKDAPKPAKSNKTGQWNAPKQIQNAFHELLNKDTAPVAGDSVAKVIYDFLLWTHENRAKRTYDRYKDFCKPFADQHKHLKIGSTNAGHVTAWLAKQEGWGPTTKRNAITAISRAFNWGVKNHGLDRNPIHGMEKPKANVRSDFITPSEFVKFVAAVRDQPFQDLLFLSYDTGMRPQEAKRLEARHVDLEKRRAVIPGNEAKGEVTRTVYFPTDRSIEIIKRLMKKRPEGVLLINNRGNAWTGFAVKNRMEDLDHVLGRRVTHYTLRHSFVTRKLLAGVDSHVVAALVGHKDTKMIDSVYSHVAEDHQFMLDAARKDITCSS